MKAREITLFEQLMIIATPTVCEFPSSCGLLKSCPSVLQGIAGRLTNIDDLLGNWINPVGRRGIEVGKEVQTRRLCPR